MPSSSTQQHLSWNEINQYAKSIAGRLPHITDIIAIGGGGIIPAGLISYYYYRQYGKQLNIRYIYAASYEDKVQRDATITWPVQGICESLRSCGAQALIVDDIADTGNTLLLFKEAFPEAKTATIVLKPESKIIPDYIGHACRSQDVWFTVPWE
jgi:hypoxanthine phosphoribosyltransferase